MTYAEYMKEYRGRNRERINEQQRVRYSLKVPSVSKNVKTTHAQIDKPVITTETTKTVASGKCLYCWSHETVMKIIEGVQYPVCPKHLNKS